mgnify:CR=1 FL=1
MVDLKIKLPNSFFEEEERCGYVTSREMKQLWAVELDLLCELDRVCKKLKIRYFLDGGTLLGAARDGRFIPWDDDVDTTMLREDYDKLLKYGPQEFQEPYFLQNAYTDDDYRRGMCQLRRSDTTAILKKEVEKHLPFNQGVFIDIFPLDGIAPEAELCHFFEEKQTFRKKLGDYAHQSEHDCLRLREMFRQYEEMCSQYRDVGYVDKIMNKRRLEKKDLNSLIPLNREWFCGTVELCFEGVSFPAPSGYKDVLSAYYGEDYNVPKRMSNYHGDLVWDVSRPYTEYLFSLL